MRRAELEDGNRHRRATAVPRLDPETEREFLRGKAETPLKRVVEFLLERILSLQDYNQQDRYKGFRELVTEYFQLSAILSADEIRQQVDIQAVEVPQTKPRNGYIAWLKRNYQWIAVTLLLVGPLTETMAEEAVDEVRKSGGNAAEARRSRFPTWLSTMENRVYHIAQEIMLAVPAVGRRFTHFEYTTRADGRVRNRPDHRHAPMHGFIAPKSDPIWDDFTPPTGFGCRCFRRPILDTEAFRRGLGDERHYPSENAERFHREGQFPDPDFRGRRSVQKGAA
jgi:uncharacterized protein with gpF-like domain